MGRQRQTATPSVVAAFGATHQWLDARLQDIGRALAGDDHERAQQAFADLARRLRHHMSVEEVFLFDEVDRIGDPAERALVRRLVAQHQTIEDLVDRVGRRLAHGLGVGAELESLAEAIEAHERLEERLVLPLCERVLPPSVRAHAIEALQRRAPRR